MSNVRKRLAPSSRLRNSRLAIVSLLAVVLLVLGGCRSNRPSSPTANELTVSGAVSLKDAFNEIAALNEKRNGTKIRFNYGSSVALQKQIVSGAPADVFASAGAKQMDELGSKGFLVSDTRTGFARNQLVL